MGRRHCEQHAMRDAFPSIAFIGSIALAFALSLFVIAAWGGFLD
jgi:hypothetical protein